MKYLFVSLLALIIVTSCQTQNANSVAINEVPKFSETEIPDIIEPIEKSSEEWKSTLTEMEYYVLREAGTERSFTGPYWDNKESGLYVCGGCGLPLFESDTKFKSGTGWPSFYEPVADKVIKEDVDYNIGYKRTEVLCARCDGHLGHVFPDGPKPTGLRYCINGASLDFIVPEELEETSNK